ncbi:hypothetical protein [Streptomyces sp. TP-A0356]|nr:hypothetical protein [Streptomyces sp. TP-A0356]
MGPLGPQGALAQTDQVLPDFADPAMLGEVDLTGTARTDDVLYAMAW